MAQPSPPAVIRRIEAELPSGVLRLQIAEGAQSFEDICGFGTRRNPRRGFLFVSRVLGKHVPVRPTVMRGVHRDLAARLGAALPGPVLFIALAETATGLGHGVFERWRERTGRSDALFIHSTRYALARRTAALTFVEPHSHATDHIVHEPADPAHRELFRTARTLVLVDDEATTGRSFLNLARAYRGLNPQLQQVRLVMLTDWMGGDVRSAISVDLGLPVQTAALVSGCYEFRPSPTFRPEGEGSVVGDGRAKDAYLPGNFGREGVSNVPSLEKVLPEALSVLRPGQRVLVLGTGEFMYPPFKLAEALELVGYDVSFQATTRSPILPGHAIGSRIEFVDNYFDDIPNFVYNVEPARYDRILVGYETHPRPPAHRLLELLGGAVAIPFA